MINNQIGNIMNQIQGKHYILSDKQNDDASPQRSDLKNGILTNNSNPTTGGRYGSSGPYVETTDQEQHQFNFSVRMN